MIVFNTGRLLLSGLLGRLLGGLLGGLLLVLLLLKSLLGSNLLHNLLLLNEEGTENATKSEHMCQYGVPVTEALVAEITAISTGDRALAGTDSLHISSRNAGNLKPHANKQPSTPARAFLQQPHFTGLAAFLVYWTTSLAPNHQVFMHIAYQGSSRCEFCWKQCCKNVCGGR